MVPVVLSILVVVLISGAVLWVVAGDRDQPTSGGPSPAGAASVAVRPPELAPPVVHAVVAPSAVARPRRPATSRRRPVAVDAPAVIEPARATPVAVPSPPPATARMEPTPLPRHRIRSSVLLVLLIALIGVLLAIVIGAMLAALAVALRAAVTS